MKYLKRGTPAALAFQSFACQDERMTKTETPAMQRARGAFAVLALVLAGALLVGCDRHIKIGNKYIGVDLNPRNSQEFFLYAIYRHDLNTVKKLVESGEVGVDDISSKEYQSRLLHDAAYYGATDIVEFLVKSGADINARQIKTSASTPLHVAIRKRHQDTALKLLDLGADPSIRLNRYGFGDGITTCRLAWNVHESTRRKADMSRVIARLPGCKDAKFDNKC